MLTLPNAFIRTGVSLVLSLLMITIPPTAHAACEDGPSCSAECGVESKMCKAAVNIEAKTNLLPCEEFGISCDQIKGDAATECAFECGVDKTECKASFKEELDECKAFLKECVDAVKAEQKEGLAACTQDKKECSEGCRE